MTPAPSFEEIFAVMSAASVGDMEARVAVPVEPDVEHTPTRFAIALNLLLDDLGTRAAEVHARLETITRQQQTINELSTPILEPVAGVLLVPLIGLLDTARARRLTASLLVEIRRRRARKVVIDLTGVPDADDPAIHALISTARAARLMGAVPVLVGLRTEVANRISSSHVDLGSVQIAPNLIAGLS